MGSGHAGLAAAFRMAPLLSVRWFIRPPLRVLPTSRTSPGATFNQIHPLDLTSSAKPFWMFPVHLTSLTPNVWGIYRLRGLSERALSK